MLTDPKKTKDEIVQWIRDYFAENGPTCSAVIGISGGKDSSVVAALLAEALGKDRVVGVLMPNGVQPDIADSEEIVNLLGIPHVTVNIAAGYAGMTSAINEALAGGGVPGAEKLSRDSEINLPPRLRMSTLYAIAQALPNGGRVANTCNRSEDYIGYSTKYGDAAGDFSVLSNLLVHEVIQIGEILGLPERPVKQIVLRDSSFVFEKDAEPLVPAMAEGVPAIHNRGVVAQFVESLQVEGVTMENTEGEQVQRL